MAQLGPLARENLELLQEHKNEKITPEDRALLRGLLRRDRELVAEELVAVSRIRARAAGRTFFTPQSKS